MMAATARGRREGDSADGILAGILVPVVTPFDAVTGDVDPVALRANLEAILAAPVRGVVVAGSTGEGVLLLPEERVVLIRAAREVVPRDRLLLAGTGAESTRATIRLTREASAAGADAVLVQPPAFYRGAMDHAALSGHYLAVAEASAVPLILYQVPPRLSTIELSTSLIAELSEHPNVIGVKDSRGDLEALGEYVTRSARGFQVLVGEASTFYAALEVGAVGGILAVANLAPGETCELNRAFQEGRSAEAGRIQEQLGPLGKEVVGRHGVPGVKAALDLLGLRGGAPRPPLRPLGDAGVAAIRQVLSEAHLPTRLTVP
jgi:4-hydroxy-2-oxoglutarate aldolase